MNTNEIINAVESLQSDIFQNSGIDYFNIVLITDGFSFKVQFLDIDLWSSEDDCRLNLDEENEESIEDCLRRRLKKKLLN